MRKNRHGNIVVPLLIILAIASFFLLKTIALNTFNSAQSQVEADIEEKYDPYSSRYSLSKQMGAISTWTTYKSPTYNFKLIHPSVWNKTEKTTPATLEYYQVQLGDKVDLSIAVQDTFVKAEKAEKINTKMGKFDIFQNEKNAKAAVMEKNKLYYIIRLKQEGYFGSEAEYKGTFYQILKSFVFLD